MEKTLGIELKALYLGWRAKWLSVWAKFILSITKQVSEILRYLHRYRWSMRFAVALAWISVTFFIAHRLAPKVTIHFSDSAALASATSLLSGIGGALIGAATIAFTLILFAMQVNVERMPHGLFRRLSSDARLLGAYALSFVLACGVAASVLLPHPSWMSYALAFALTVIVAEVALFVYAYQRALLLINPGHQLSIVIGDVRRAFRSVDRWVERLRPLLGVDPLTNIPDGKDAARLAFQAHNPDWSASARQGIAYATSYAQRFAEQGDYEIVRKAYSTVMT